MKKKKKKKKKKKNEKPKREQTDNTIGDEGASAIGESLKINTTLTELDLYSDEKEIKVRKEK